MIHSTTTANGSVTFLRALVLLPNGWQELAPIAVGQVVVVEGAAFIVLLPQKLLVYLVMLSKLLLLLLLLLLKVRLLVLERHLLNASTIPLVIQFVVEIASVELLLLLLLNMVFLMVF